MNKTKPPTTVPARVDTAMHPDHRADLKRSGLTDQIIVESGIKSVRPEDIAKVLGQDPPGVQSVYIIPYPGPDYFYRCKVFPPFTDRDGHLVKYLQKAGTRSYLYIPASTGKVLPNPAIPLAIVEGEKKALRAIQEGLPAIGIGGLWSWLHNGKPLPEFETIAFADRDVVLYPDSDVWSRPDLLRPVYALGRELQDRGAQMFIGRLTPGPNGEKRGLDDFEKIEVDRENYSILDVVYLELKHKTFSRLREWYDTWKKAKGSEKDDTLAGRPLFQRVVEPWRDAINGAHLLEVLATKFRRYVWLPPMADVACALWIVQTYCTDVMSCLPILSITSATKREGKTTLLEVVTALCAKPCPTANISPAALFRSIEAWGPTLICDEMDIQFRKNDDLRTLMNSGHTRASAHVIRIVGERLEPRAFSVFGSKAVGLIGKLPPTMQDRSIEIRMRRKLRGQRTARIVRSKLEQECSVIRSQIVRWLADNEGMISEQTVSVPTELDDRATDNWRGLFAIAMLAGHPWPERAKQAARSLSQVRGEEVDLNEELLADLRQIFGDKNRVLTAIILELLNSMDDRPWPTALRGKPMDAYLLGRKLRPFKIRPKDIRFGIRKAKGYERAGNMQDAFDTYLTPILSETPEQNEESQDVTEDLMRDMIDPCLASHGDLTMEDDSLNLGVADETEEDPPWKNVQE